jgi:SAM-dependent methyltransferase
VRQQTIVESTEIERMREENIRRSQPRLRERWSWSSIGGQYIHCQMLRCCISELAEAHLFPLEDLDVADVGCGDGTMLLELVQWGASPKRLAAIDLDEPRVRRAREKLPSANICLGDTRRLPWPTASFDLVTQFTVFTSILDPATRRAAAQEMIRVLRPGGSLLWFDFRYDNPHNKHVRGIGVKEVRNLFPGCDVHFTRAILAPPLARAIAPVSWIATLLLEKVPLLRTHYGAVIKDTRDLTPGRAVTADGASV